jgi:hypothetical protein
MFVLPTGSFAVQYLYTLIRGEFDYFWVEELHQSLGIVALTEDPVGSLLNNHIQPPGLNLLFAIALQSSNSKFTLQLFFFIVTIATILIVTYCAKTISKSEKIGMISGTFYSLLPTTVLYSLYPYNQSLVALGFALSSLGLLNARMRGSFSAISWCLGLLLVFLVRPSMIWILAIFLGLIPFLTGIFRFEKIIYLLFILLIPVTSIQGYYFYKFGLSSTSSWSSMNRIDALVGSGVISIVELEKATSGDKCLESIVDKQRNTTTGAFDFWGDIRNLDESCFVGKTRFIPGKYLVEGEKGPSKFPYYQNIQRNTSERLLLSRHWDDLANKLLKQEPLAPLQMAVGSNGATSSFEVLVRPGYSFIFLAGNLWAGAPLNMFFRPIGAIFPSTSIFTALVVVIILQLRRTLGFREILQRKILIMNFIIFVWIAISVLASIGENARHLVEVYPLMVLNFAFATRFLDRGQIRNLLR